MSENKAVYHNELIGLISILSVLQHHKRMSLGKVMLILPFFAHKNTLNVLKRKNTKTRSLEEFIMKYPSYISNYNERFHSLILTSINSVILLQRMKIIKIQNGILILNENEHFELTNKSLGIRAKDIVLAGEKLSEILMEDTLNIYLQLRVEL